MYLFRISKQAISKIVPEVCAAICEVWEDQIKVWDYFDKFSFLCDMYNEELESIEELILHFYPFDNSVQVLNPAKGKKLLRRIQIPSITFAKLQVGNIVNVFSKLLLITDCVPATKRTLFKNVESTFVLIKPIHPKDHGKILTYIMKKGFRIVRLKNGKINKDFALQLYRSISGNSMLPIIIDYVTSGEIIGIELSAPKAVSKFRSCLGATNPKDADPDTLRGMYGENTLKNIAHGCDTVQEAAEMLELFFGYENGLPRIPFRATYKDCTCCVIKPHVVIDGNVGAIHEQISTSGLFYISAMATFTVKLCNAEEFYEVYKGVLPEYETMAIQLAEGKCIALEVKCTDPSKNVVCEFRKLCGPRDPDLCRQLYPNSIRAQYGKSIIQNAVHCTDLPEDGESEVEYFFKFLANE